MAEMPTNETQEAPAPANDQAVLYRKMAAVMGALERLPKDGVNTKQGYTYATASGVADAIRVEMAKQRLALFVEMLEASQEVVGTNGTGTRTHAKFKFTLACGDTGATRDCFWEAQADDYGDKGMSKVTTVAKKYFLMTTFIMSSGDEKDPDAEPGIERTPQTQQRQPAQQRQATSQRQPSAQSSPQGQQPPTLPQWVTAENIAKVVQAIKQQATDITDAQIVQHAGIESLMDLNGWGQYQTGKLAGDTVVTNWKNSKPATPKGKSTEQQPEEMTFETVNDRMYTIFNKQSEDVLAALEIESWEEKFDSPKKAWDAAISLAIKSQWPFVAEEVEYVEKGRAKYLEFKSLIPVRAYGRSTTFKKLVGDDWYNENGVEQFKPGQRYPIETVLISYEPKGTGDAKYLNFTGLTVLAPDDAPPSENADPEAYIDAFFAKV